MASIPPFQIDYPLLLAAGSGGGMLGQPKWLLFLIYIKKMSLLKIPEKLKIGGFEWRVKEVKHLISDRERLGEMAPRTQEIVIEEESSEQQKEETLIHEIIEALNFLYNINLEHYQIELLGVTLHQVLKDNKINFL